MKRFAIALVVMGVFNVSFAHEGHDKTPGAVTAPHGGVIKGTDQLYLELVNEAGEVKIYPLNHDSAPLPLKEVALQGSVTFPKKAKSVPVTFIQGVDYFSAKVDTKGAYRYFLNLTVTYKGKKEKIKFQVEPQG